jgi:hypothetical protein
MGLMNDLKMYARFAWGLRGFLRHTITLEEAEIIVRQRMAEREGNFLRLVEKGIFGHPRSPYLPLLRLAQVEARDIEVMVHDRGLEGTLSALREAGVYVTFEEFKGREPIVRDGKAIYVRANDFDNPCLKHHYQTQSSGSTGAGTRVTHDLDHLADNAPYLLLADHAHGLLNAQVVLWRPILPSGTGINHILCRARIGNVPQKWFSPITSRDLRPSLKYRVATQYMTITGRLLGVPMPWPEAVGLEEAIVVACSADEIRRAHGKCVVRTSVSFALRVCLAAQEEEIDLTGVTFLVGGEPATPAKVRRITRTGARCVPTYFFAEAGAVGWGCARPADGNDIHFFKDALAMIQHPRQVPHSDITVEAFHFTTLLPSAPKLLLNVESDDFGIMENRSCGCALESCGFTEHLRQIRSFHKLTGEGVTLVGSEMVSILEEVLPNRFGGSPLDYQLLEEEDDHGFTRLHLVVSPKIKIANEAEVIEVVLQALKQGNAASDLATAIWSQAGTLRVRRREPILTAGGKQVPLHVIPPPGL